MRRCLILACALVLLPALAFADEVLLKGGVKISGRILSRTDSAVQVDVGAGVITVPMASVLSIEQKRSVVDDYEERAARVKDGDVQGWLQLAHWSMTQGLGTQARRAYEHVLGIEPQNVEANQGLNRVLVDGRWVPEPEVHRARGMVQFEGAWMMPAERDAILEERDDRFNELLRIDAERRARDAEERAAEAEARAQSLEQSNYAGGLPLWYGGAYVVGGYPSYGYGYGRPGYGRPGYGKPGRPPVGNPWPPLGMYPTSPLGVFPTFPIGPTPSYPIGPAGSFPIGPSPPARAIHPAPVGGGRHAGPPRGSAPARSSPPPAAPPVRGGGAGGPAPRP